MTIFCKRTGGSVDASAGILPVPFIVGSGRSGTTLLRLMLDAHPDLAIPPETHFIPSVDRACEMSPDPREAFLSNITAFWTWEDMHVSAHLLRQGIAALDPFTVGEGLRTFYLLYAARFGKFRWGDKSYYVPSMVPIQALLPEARFLHIIRDGRDVALSILPLWFGPNSIHECAVWWSQLIRQARSQMLHLRWYMEVRYEDLVLDTASTLRRICDFIEVPWNACMLDYHKHANDRMAELGVVMNPNARRAMTADERRGIHGRLSARPDSTRIARWRHEMLDPDREAFEGIAGDILWELGYDVSPQLAARQVVQRPDSIESSVRTAPSVRRADDSRILQFTSYLVGRTDLQHCVLLGDLQSVKADAVYPPRAVAVISLEFAALEAYPELATKLRKLLRTFAMALLVDRTFPPLAHHSIKSIVARQRLSAEFVGRTGSDGGHLATLAIVRQGRSSAVARAPADFRVVALISTYNEEDVIEPVIEHLFAEGVEVYLIDNWSTDHTYEIARQLRGHGVLGLERWPQAGPSPLFDWAELLDRKAELARELRADWFMHHDADEVRESPWKGVTLRDAMYRVDHEGYNAVDFTVVNFVPTDNGYEPGSDVKSYFKYIRFGDHPAHFVEIKAWKRFTDIVKLSASGGHSVEFPGRKIHPYKFLLRHYPIRSQSHGELKLFRDRMPRYHPARRSLGWHTHYDHYHPGSSFLGTPHELIRFDDDFYVNYLIERLSGVGAPVQDAAIQSRRPAEG